MSLGALERHAKATEIRSSPYGTILHDAVDNPASLAVDATPLYWTETALGAVTGTRK